MSTRQTFGYEQAARARKLPGWTVTREDKGYRIQAPAGASYTVHMTPGSSKAEQGAQAELRRLGLDAAEASYAATTEIERKRRIAQGVADATRATARAQRDSERAAKAVSRFAVAEVADLDWLLTPHPFPDVRRMVITPDVAEKLLDANTHNRPTSKTELLEWERTLNDKRYRFTHEGIAFDSVGRVHDGQHRLIGCVRTGVAIDVFVFVGMDPEAFPFINKGRKRTTADDLGVVDIPNASQTAAMLRLVWLYDHVAYTLWRFTRVKSDMFADYLTADLDEVRYAVSRASQWKRETGMTGSVGAAGIYLIRRANRDTAPEQLEEWLRGLRTGADVHGGDARLALKRLFLQNAHPEQDKAYQIAMFLKAWKHHVTSNGESAVAHMVFRQGAEMPDVAILHTGTKPRKRQRP
jgi:hypothetical protein